MKLKKALNIFISYLITGNRRDDISINFYSQEKEGKLIVMKSFYLLEHHKISTKIKNTLFSEEDTAYFLLAQIIIHAMIIETSAFDSCTTYNNYTLIENIYKLITGDISPNNKIISYILEKISRNKKEIITNYKEIMGRIGYPMGIIEYVDIGLIIRDKKSMEYNLHLYNNII